ncbi:choline/carnitine O-acyltransferase [Desulfonema magnum]|uniref:Acyltransferase domain-containing protein n=1 Tax=Desulfonema magnum TaxID=45655 RepID=A0A975BJ51_9BACT|nr:choline/carnitine O-acyltransferase [Desulfonema magnum]QTA86282.1 Acyltransferase domain-containing protein [Desulfonema magnum]
MFRFQETLPKLPLPSLKKTCEGYLNMVRPLLTESEFIITRKAVMDFHQGVGKQLQNQLKMIDLSTNTSYLHAFMEDNYLENRSPLPVNRNPVTLAEPISEYSNLTFPHFVANIVHNTLIFYMNIKNRELSPDIEIGKDKGHLYGMCMFQYDKMFGSTRIPCIKRDIFQVHNNSVHAIVIYRNVFYTLPLIKEGKISVVREIEQKIKWIIKDVPFGPPVGVLTGMNRTDWAIIRFYMASVSKKNKRSLELIDKALFVICLDETFPYSLEEELKNGFYGFQNRWFDKPIQLIFTPNNCWSFNMEHTGFDGYLKVKFFREVNRKIQGYKQVVTTCDPPKKLQWELNQKVLKEIDRASIALESLNARHELMVLEFKEFGSDWVESHGLDSDAFFQLAIQLAYIRLHGHIGSISEVVGTRNFQYGRFETFLTVTDESVKFIKTISEADSNEIRYSYLKRAVNAHYQNILNCKQGNYIRFHLFALRTLALYQGLAIDMFQDNAYKNIFCQPIVCTTSLGPRYISCSPFVTAHGYSINYTISKEKIVLNVLTSEQRAEEFIKEINLSLLELKNIAEVK